MNEILMLGFFQSFLGGIGTLNPKTESDDFTGSLENYQNLFQWFSENQMKENKGRYHLIWNIEINLED